MSALTFDPASSEVTIETKAVGMLAKLAHDLSIAAGELSAALREDGDKLVITLELPVPALQVRGVRRAGVVDATVLSRSDQADITQKLRREVLVAPKVVARVACEGAAAALSEEGRRDVAVDGSVEVGRGKTRVAGRASVTVSSARVVAEGRTKVSLPGLGIKPPKGPLGAFRVEDDVEIVYRLCFERG